MITLTFTPIEFKYMKDAIKFKIQDYTNNDIPENPDAPLYREMACKYKSLLKKINKGSSLKED